MRKILLLLLMLWGLNNAWAQEKEDTTYKSLEEVTVSLNKWEQNMNEVPNKIAKINLREARLHNPQTAADMLNMTGFVFIQKSQMGGGSPMIRGFAANRVLIVVDGVRMNNAIFRSGNLQNVISLDALATQSAEVIFGPGSIIYGSDAIGGVMDFHSLHVSYTQDDKWRFRSNGVVRYSSANNEKTGHVDFSAAHKRFAYIGSVTYSDFGDLKMGRHGGDDSYLRNKYAVRINNRDSVFTNDDPYLQKFTGYHQLNLVQKLRYRLSPKIDLQYTFHYSGTGDVPRYDRLIETSGSGLAFAEWYYGPQLWRMHALQAGFSNANRFYNSSRLVVAYQRYRESRHDRRFNNARLRNQVEKVGAFSANFDFEKKLAGESELFYGVEYLTNKVHSTAYRVNINSGITERVATRYPDNSDWNSYGVYGSYRINIKKFTFTTGLRYSYVNVYTPFDTSLFKFPFTEASLRKGAATVNAGFVYKAGQRSQVSFNFATGFRVPNVDDVGKVFESAPGQITVPNPDLGSEYAWNFDLGYAARVNDNLKFDITAFYTILDDAITRRPDTFNGADSIVFEGINSQVFSLQNAARARVWGVQAGIEAILYEGLTASVQANWIEGKETDDVKDEDVPLRHAPPVYGNAHIKYDRKKIQADLYAIWNGEISAANLAPSEQAKTFIYAKDENGKPYSPSWYTLNLKLGYQVNRHLLLSAGLENITDQRYRTYSSGIVSPGVNFVGSARVSL